MKRLIASLGLSVLLFAVVLPGVAFAEAVALTFDDLPTLSLTDSVSYAQITTRILLAGLKRHRLQATGFVTEGKLTDAGRIPKIALLAAWLDAGMELGDHGYSHESLNETPVDAYICDVSRGEEVTRALLAWRGRTPKWFRPPYLATGATLQARTTFEAWLKRHGYRIAPVTMENADWMFALPYDDAVIEGDVAKQALIKQSYIDYTAKMVVWYREAALQLLGRRPSFVFLLHASRLNADSIDQLAAILKANDLYGVSLQRAMSDPAYSIPDTYVGPNGDEWLSRWSLTLNKPLPWSDFTEPPAAIAAEDHRLDSSP